MFIPSVPSLPSRPHPIQVIRESVESFEAIPDRSPTTAEALRQTFPETPQAFSPLFSANVGTPGVPPLPSSVGTPGTPSSAAYTKGKLRRGISNPAIKRAASLHTRKTPSSSNRARMSPIPSAPGTPQSPEIRKANDVRNTKFEAQQSQAVLNLLTTTPSSPGKVFSPVPPSPRRSSDPSGRVSRDLEKLAGRVELPEEVSCSTSDVKKTEPSENSPSQWPTPTPQEKIPSLDVRSMGAAEGEVRHITSDSRGKGEDNVNTTSPSRVSPQGSTQSDNRVRRSGPKQRPRPLDLPVVSSDNASPAPNRPARKQSDGSPGIHREQENAESCSQTDATLTTGTIPAVSADTTTPVVTPARLSPATSVRSSDAPGQSPPRMNALPSPDPSSRTTPNTSTTLSPVPPSQLSSSFNHTPTSSTSQTQSTTPALPSSTLVSPARYERSNQLDVPSFASFLRQSYTDLVAIHPPPPYQTAILSQAIPVNGENGPPAGSGTSLPSYVQNPENRQSDGPRPIQPAQLPQTQAQRSAINVAPVSEGVVRERSDSVTDTRTHRNRPLGPRNPSSSQGSSKASLDRSRQGSVSSVQSHSLRSGVGLGAPPTSRKLSTTTSRGKSGPRFPTVPIRWRGYTLDVARWTFTSQQLQEIASRAIKASAESYYVRLLRLEVLDTELPEELHRLELLTTELKTKLRATAAARRELLDALTAHVSGTRGVDRYNLERVVEELGEVTQSAEELNDELYTVADQIAQLKRLQDVHFSSALAMSLRKLNTSFLRQATENQFLRERVAALEAERDIAWTQAEHVAQEFDDLSTKLEQGIASTPSSANNSCRTSRISAVRKSSVRASKSGLRQSIIAKPSPKTQERSSSISSTTPPSLGIPPVPPIPGMQDLGNPVSQRPRNRPPFIQTANLPDQITPGEFSSF